MIIKIADILRRIGDDDRGFTLIELLVVVAILGVLAAIAVPMVTGAIDDARTNADAANVKILNDALDRYYFDNSGYPDTLAGLVDDYIEAVPEDPWGQGRDYEDNYDSDAGEVEALGAPS